ncbi:MAG: DEAD/DEAH box helicase, partial [Planctomycetes bacterium]|nr:DEAD/DEAH box helicase [Planctomycetota bacterium]
MTFERFQLDPTLLLGVRDMGYSEPTTIQERTIPAVMRGTDVIGVAQTGTGKTAAFLLPILHRLLQGPPHTTRALIISPTRELAIQIDEMRLGLAYHTQLSGCVVYGGADILPQVRALKGGADIVTATPGRLLDHLWHGLPKLERIEVLVLDEADRLLDMGFLPDVEMILRRLPEQRQNLLFSATMPPEIERLAQHMMHDPETIAVGPRSRPVDTVRQELFQVEAQDKTRLLLRLLSGDEMRSVLVFSGTKAGADRVHADLQRKGIECCVIHSNRSQQERFTSLQAFRQGKARVLVATDVAARGLDIDGISHVINFDVPRAAEDYVHRIGRTARAGEKGHAITLATPREARAIAAIEQLIKTRIPRGSAPGSRADSQQHGASHPAARRGAQDRGKTAAHGQRQ